MHWIVVNLVSAVIACGVIAPVTWWSLDRDFPFEVISSSPIPNPAYPGDKIDFQWVVNIKRIGCSGKFSRESIDQHGAIRTFVPMDTSYGSLPLGIHTMHTTQPFVVPDPAFPGEIRVQSIFRMECNPIHKLWPMEYRTPDAIVTVGARK